MRAYVTHDADVLATYSIRDADPLDCDHYARRYASEKHDATVEQSCGQPRSYIPCGGDFTVTVAEAWQGPFGASCWQSRNYYLDRGESE